MEDNREQSDVDANETRRYYDNADVDAFYDSVWGGEDIHIGIYADRNEDIATASGRTISHTADKAADLLGPHSNVVDLGSGYGGSARALATRFGCRVAALDLSEHHNRRHRSANIQRGLDTLIDVTTGTLDELPYPAHHFDVAWSLEVLCHAPDRTRALSEAMRVLRPGGALLFSDIMAAENAPADALQPALRRLGIPALATPSFYREQLSALGFTRTEFEDRSEDVTTHYARLEEEVRRRAAELRDIISPAYLQGLLTNLPLWKDLTHQGLVRWGLFHARKPHQHPGT
ncbi:class I SAM-dependent methyltransferase [Streptomyces luteolus]|uniref:Methyltransferase domain-containing protein n=1 Tax=Streptomyces luteolus TaxID=3043615 RepID=A0ABT6T3L6_9ACTN|nr:class I SAM-dependent methyltransferase [Streptomyces sp. B-S-A12]MDI3421644.1 methyltransferase domain-containing protein [Streptomyces sp. B-S-A12]